MNAKTWADSHPSCTVTTVLRAADGTLTPIETVERVAGDPNHVPGAVLLTVSGRPILTAELWDDIDWLWVFLLNAIEKCRNEGEASTYFPDQPIEISLTLVCADDVEIRVSARGGLDRRARARRDEFFGVVLAGGRVFFERMSELLPQQADGYRPSLDLIDKWPLDSAR